jgi:hypothetical protein
MYSIGNYTFIQGLPANSSPSDFIDCVGAQSLSGKMAKNKKERLSQGRPFS